MLFYLWPHLLIPAVTVETYQNEIDAALKSFEKYIICIDKTPEDCANSLQSLMKKAIAAYENRGEGMRHGIALDNQVTVILSQSTGETPLCGIYFNLHSPYKKAAKKKAEPKDA